jgi:hypothetical protein
MTTPKKPADIRVMIEKSSLGDRDARRARARVSTETAQQVVRRAANYRTKSDDTKSGG